MPAERDSVSLPADISALSTNLDELADCCAQLAELVRGRAEGPWDSRQHAHYLRLRRRHTETYRRVVRAQRTFDRARLERFHRESNDTSRY